jgi:hypothetical protein
LLRFLQGFRHAHDIIIRFDFRQGIDDLLLSWSFDALGQVPAGLWEMRALEDGESRSKAYGGRSFRIIEQAAKSFDGAGGEVAHAVLQSGDVFALGIFEGGLE